MFYPAPDQLTIAVPDAVHSFDEAVLAMLTMSGDPLVGAEALVGWPWLSTMSMVPQLRHGMAWFFIKVTSDAQDGHVPCTD